MASENIRISQPSSEISSRNGLGTLKRMRNGINNKNAPMVYAKVEPNKKYVNPARIGPHARAIEPEERKIPKLKP